MILGAGYAVFATGQVRQRRERQQDRDSRSAHAPIVVLIRRVCHQVAKEA